MEASAWRLCSSGPIPESLQLAPARKQPQPGRFGRRAWDRPGVRVPPISSSETAMESLTDHQGPLSAAAATELRGEARTVLAVLAVLASLPPKSAR